MKQLLYLTANTKPEAQSTSKTVGRMVVNKLEQRGNMQVEEVDLYTVSMPTLDYRYFADRNTLIGSDGVHSLPADRREDVAQINRLCDQFVAADVVVLAAPMWSLSFPAVVKNYLDHVIIAGKTIGFKNQKPYGLLSDRERTFVYVQSSGGNLPALLRPMLNRGVNYCEEMVKFMGIAHFYSLLADGTGTTESERLQAIADAAAQVEPLVDAVMGG